MGRSSRFHLVMMLAWAVLLIPSLTSWQDSVPWVVFMSWYANFDGHWTKWQAAKNIEKRDA